MVFINTHYDLYEVSIQSRFSSSIVWQQTGILILTSVQSERWFKKFAMADNIDLKLIIPAKPHAYVLNKHLIPEFMEICIMAKVKNSYFDYILAKPSDKSNNEEDCISDVKFSHDTVHINTKYYSKIFIRLENLSLPIATYKFLINGTHAYTMTSLTFASIEICVRLQTKEEVLKEWNKFFPNNISPIYDTLPMPLSPDCTENLVDIEELHYMGLHYTKRGYKHRFCESWRLLKLKMDKKIRDLKAWDLPTNDTDKFDSDIGHFVSQIGPLNCVSINFKQFMKLSTPSHSKIDSPVKMDTYVYVNVKTYRNSCPAYYFFDITRYTRIQVIEYERDLSKVVPNYFDFKKDDVELLDIRKSELRERYSLPYIEKKLLSE